MSNTSKYPPMSEIFELPVDHTMFGLAGLSTDKAAAHAINRHDDLVEALENVTAALRNVLPLIVMTPADREARRKTLSEAEQAISRARGEGRP